MILNLDKHCKISKYLINQPVRQEEPKNNEHRFIMALLIFNTVNLFNSIKWIGPKVFQYLKLKCCLQMSTIQKLTLYGLCLLN